MKVNIWSFEHTLKCSIFILEYCKMKQTYQIREELTRKSKFQSDFFVSIMHLVQIELNVQIVIFGLKLDKANFTKRLSELLSAISTSYSHSDRIRF